MKRNESSEIIKLFLNRDEAAISAVSEKYTNYCIKIAMNILGSVEDAEECVNEAFFKAWELIPPNEPQMLSAFLGKLTRNLAISKRREQLAEKRGQGQGAAVFDELSEVIPADSSVEREQESRELVREINAFLKRLSPQKRNIFICRYWYYDSVKEIASEQGMSENNVSVILSRTRQKLKAYLTKKGMM